MHLNNWYINRSNGIPQGNTVMGKGSRIENDKIHSLGRGLLNHIYQTALVVGLIKFCLHSLLRRLLSQHFVNILQSRTAINLWFSGTQHIQIWTMHYQYFAHFYYFLPVLTGYAFIACQP